MTTIVQLSDTHITANGRLAYGKVDTSSALARAVAHINALPQQLGPIDAVVVSGDLTDLGTDEEYRRFLELTDSLEPPLLVLPGNHDDRVAMRRAFAGTGHFTAANGPLDHATMIGALHLIMLDSTVPGKPHGWLEPGQLTWLDRQLGARPSEPTIVFLHHPPFDTGIDHMDMQRLLNAQDLFEVLKRHAQVRLVSAGHVHRAISANVHGLACMIVAAPAHAVTLDTTPGAEPTFMMEPGAITVHRWKEDGSAGVLTSLLSYSGSFEGPHPFFTEDKGFVTA